MAAPKGNKFGEGEGRPTSYNKKFDEQAYNYCLLGATDVQLARFFNVCEATINNWKNKQPSFLESIRAGKELADVEVAKSLYNRCLGPVLTRQKEVKLKQIDRETGKIIERLEIVDLEYQEVPDTNAIKFWLTNRQKETWNEKHHIDHTSMGEKISKPEVVLPEGMTMNEVIKRAQEGMK